MRKTAIRRSLCIATATLSAIGFTACGSTNAARTEARVEHASETTYEDAVTGGASTTDPALYAIVNDREQCACGYDFKADYTTQIYKIYADSTEEVIGDYDSHYDLYPLGVTDEGKIVFAYHYDEHDKVVKTHEEYEKLEFVSIEELEKLQGGGEKEDDGKIVESGYVLMDAADDSAHELEKICLTNTYYEHNFVRGNNIILTNDDEILRLAPDQNGQYKETHYETPVGIKGYYTSLYVSSSGDYVVFPQYTEDCKDTTVNVLHFNGDKADLIFSEYYEGWNIEIKAVYRITYFDEETGDFYGYYDETAEGGTRNLRYEANAYGE